jgi:hypothetical protein
MPEQTQFDSEAENAASTRSGQPLEQGYGNDTGYARQPASDTHDPNEPTSGTADDDGTDA